MSPRDWQLYCRDLSQRGSHLLQHQQWSDCSFLVGAEPNQIPFKAHKLLLAMSSPVFEVMFFGVVAETREVVTVPDVQPEAFQALLEYIYTDNIKINTFLEACELYYVAKKYMFPHLVEECVRRLKSFLNSSNACYVYKFAKLYDEEKLLSKALQFIRSNTKQVLASKSFEEADISTVIAVLSQEELNIDSELDLFKALVRYAEAMAKRMPEEKGSSENTCVRYSTTTLQIINLFRAYYATALHRASQLLFDGWTRRMCRVVVCASANQGCLHPHVVAIATTFWQRVIKSQLQGALEKIRFLALTPQQFADTVADTSLLTEAEAHRILLNIASRNVIPMPENFSTSILPRIKIEQHMYKMGHTRKKKEFLMFP